MSLKVDLSEVKDPWGYPFMHFMAEIIMDSEGNDFVRFRVYAQSEAAIKGIKRMAKKAGNRKCKIYRAHWDKWEKM